MTKIAQVIKNVTKGIVRWGLGGVYSKNFKTNFAKKSVYLFQIYF